MSQRRNQIIFFAIAVAESVIVFAILGVIGQILGFGYSPLPWSTLLLLYIAGMFVSWLTGGLRGDIWRLAFLYGGSGLFSLYLAVATTRVGQSASFDIYWIYRLFNRDLGAETVVALVIAVIVSALIWRRTGGIIRDDRDSPDHLKRVFKLGLAVLAIALIVDEFVDTPVGIARLLIPYFVATLAGMSIARLPDDSPVAGRWARVILVSLGGFIGLGLVAGYAGGRYGSTGLGALFAIWGWLVDGLIWLLRWPLTVIGWIIALIIEWLQSFFSGEVQEQEQQQAQGERPQFTEREGAEGVDSAWVEAVLDALQWPLTFLLLLVLLVVLALAYRRIVRRIARDDDVERESIRDEVEDVSYLDLLKGLLPDWMLRRGSGRSLWRYPEDPGIKEVFLLYFESMELALERGMVFNANQTPTERAHEMGSVLRGAPIDDITARFNAACYGNIISTDNEIESLRSRLISAVEALDRETKTQQAESLTVSQ